MSIRNFAPEQDRQLAVEYASGATYRQLAKKHGGTDISVRSAVLRGGATPRPPHKRSNWSDNKQAEALGLYQDGLSVKKVAAHFGCRTTVITELLLQHDVVLKPGGRDHPKFQDKIECAAVAHDYEAGASLAALAKRYACTTPTIAKAIKRGGGQLRRPGVSVRWTSEVVQWAVGQYQSGRSQQSIADELGVHQTSVSSRLRAAGALPVVVRRREDHGSWKGGRVVVDDGYVWVLPADDDLDFCKQLSGGYVAEHRLVMGRALGRKLSTHETVHHINGDRADNRPENLQLRQGRHGKGVVMVCSACGSHDVKAVEIAT